MIDAIFAIKFLHLVGAASMLGAWLCVAVFMMLAHRSGNPSVMALTSQFVVSAEKFLVAPAIALQPLSGFPLASAIGLSPFYEFWIDVSLLLYVAIVACWIYALRVEIAIRRLAREAALNSVPLGGAYRREFRTWRLLAVPILLGMIAIFALMVWQPRLD
jgi:uncharacterized membrane protein